MAGGPRIFDCQGNHAVSTQVCRVRSWRGGRACIGSGAAASRQPGPRGPAIIQTTVIWCGHIGRILSGFTFGTIRMCARLAQSAAEASPPLMHDDDATIDDDDGRRHHRDQGGRAMDDGAPGPRGVANACAMRSLMAERSGAGGGVAAAGGGRPRDCLARAPQGSPSKARKGGERGGQGGR